MLPLQLRWPFWSGLQLRIQKPNVPVDVEAFDVRQCKSLRKPRRYVLRVSQQRACSSSRSNRAHEPAHIQVVQFSEPLVHVCGCGVMILQTLHRNGLSAMTFVSDYVCAYPTLTPPWSSVEDISVSAVVFST